MVPGSAAQPGLTGRTTMGIFMSNEYHLADGSPRYGHRSEPSTDQPAATAGFRVEEAAEGAARLGLDEMAAAIDKRLSSSWADKPDASLAALRDQNPEELAAAKALVKLHLGSQRQWRMKAQAVRDKQLSGLLDRRKASGSAREILALRLGLIIALIAPPAFIVATNQTDVLKLVIVGAICLAAAFLGGHFLTIRARVPVMPTIRGPWLGELREDVVNATLVAILQNKGAALSPAVAEAGRRGWTSIQDAAAAVAALQG
ncbi:hypothetical protein PUN71_022160 [Arthrobacter sp. NQ7]|uniref:hypothetical protein n=1 Tax=Arthrobacter sp. NQ7 TaxID=3032303 RepID=UPI0024105A48|nr:hypothetical protein [Arthrobacter sp. NQ7]MDJ0459915.1 hypothetical protein [Arthrobacter sp. NQ7]